MKKTQEKNDGKINEDLELTMNSKKEKMEQSTSLQDKNVYENSPLASSSAKIKQIEQVEEAHQAVARDEVQEKTGLNAVADDEDEGEASFLDYAELDQEQLAAAAPTQAAASQQQAAHQSGSQ